MSVNAMDLPTGQQPEGTTVERLKSIFQDCFKEPFEPFPLSLTPRDVRKWDSTHNVQLLIQIEEHFGIEFSGSELAKMQSVGAICEMIDAKLGK